MLARILIVDDDERNALAAAVALEELGHEIAIARSGAEALRRLMDEEFAVILLDVHMPEMDGYETAALIRGRKRTSSVPIVFLTAVSRDEHHLFQAYSAGAVDVVFKPVDPFVLRAKVSVLVDLHLKTQAIQRESEDRRILLERYALALREKEAAQRSLKQAEARQAAILRSLPIVVHARDAQPPFAAHFVSENCRNLTGFDPSSFLAAPDFGLGRVHPDDRERVTAALEAATRTGAYACEFRWLHADGGYRTFLDEGVLAPQEGGGPPELFGSMTDVTDRRSLEEQLAQARKMETVGQLTGGVAHDFNNLLTVVLGNVDLLSRKIQDPRQSRQLAAVREAAERGRSLTRQLLAFSRRQRLQPVVVDANKLITHFAPLMRQAVGEAVVLKTQLSEEPLAVEVDAAQLESALLNLAINARDAMPSGGEIVIRTARLRPDGTLRSRWPEAPDTEHVCIEVQDDGTGMDAEVLGQIFEPFFTTKEVGQGSGLGLSQVYGFVRQSGGFVTADSRPGQGATFRLYLQASAKLATAAETCVAAPAHGGSERILVVEDDPAVLALSVETLKGLGYAVATAKNAKAALRVLRKDRLDLLFSDVVMPGGANGIDLAKAARQIRPDLKILLTSGFTGDASRLAASEYPLIEKPYARDQLAAALRATLDVSAPAGQRDGNEIPQDLELSQPVGTAALLTRDSDGRERTKRLSGG